MAVADLDSVGEEDRAPAEVRREPEINKLFRMVMKHEGSDLHLKAGSPPMMRLRNAIRQMDMRALSADDLERLLWPILPDRCKKLLEDTGGADFAYVIGNDECRFRVNLFKQRGRHSLVARRVSSKIPSFEKLNLPSSIEKLCHFDQGMIILAGVTGSGKSTTIASMLDYINDRERVHILTIEDPIEYLFTDKKAVINQREIGLDVTDWSTAVKHVVPPAPDVLRARQMRDK